MYIDSFEILNLPHSNSNWKIGDIVRPDGKNTLFIGGNETGKSTMLGLLHDSIDRCDNILNKNSSYLKTDGFQKAFGCFENERDRGEDYEDQELYYNIGRALNEIYKLGTLNIWDLNYRAKRAYLNGLIQVKEGDYNKGLSGEVSDIFMDAIDIYAQRENIDPEVMYGNLAMMVQGSHDQIQGDIQWGHIKPVGKNIFVPKRIVLDLEKKDTNESGGEWSKRILGEVRGEVIAFLKHPLKELDVASQDQQTEFLIDGLDSDTQVFMESHDRAFVKEAKKSDKWLVQDLGEKKVEQEV